MVDVDNFLEHHGVKGMKWGVHKSRVQTPATLKDRPAGRKLKTTGGQGHEAAPEAVRAALLARQGKKSKAQSLTNKELQDVITRMNLEQQFNRLPATQSTGRKLASAILGSTGDREIGQIAGYAVAKSGKAAAGPAVVIGVGAAKTLAKGASKK